MANQYLQLQLQVGTLVPHKFLPFTKLSPDYVSLSPTDIDFRFMLEVYMDDYIGLAIPIT